MKLIDHIFDALGEATAIATATGIPVQTVHSWKAKGSIPHWRRAVLLDVPVKAGKRLCKDAKRYLKSVERTPRVAAEPTEQVSAAA